MKRPLPKTLIRALRKTDLPAALDLWRNTEGMSLTESDNIESLSNFLRRNPGYSSAATVDGKLIGAILCSHDAWRGFLYHLAVAKKFRRRGIAKKLVTRSLEKLRAEKLHRVSIHVLAKNKEGLAWWQRADWFARTEVTLLQFKL